MVSHHNSTFHKQNQRFFPHTQPKSPVLATRVGALRALPPGRGRCSPCWTRSIEDWSTWMSFWAADTQGAGDTQGSLPSPPNLGAFCFGGRGGAWRWWSCEKKVCFLCCYFSGLEYGAVLLFSRPKARAFPEEVGVLESDLGGCVGL